MVKLYLANLPCEGFYYLSTKETTLEIYGCWDFEYSIVERIYSALEPFKMKGGYYNCPREYIHNTIRNVVNNPIPEKLPVTTTSIGNNPREIGLFIRMVRQEQELSYEQLAAVVDIPEETLAKAEAGEPLPLLTILNILSALGIKLYLSLPEPLDVNDSL